MNSDRANFLCLRRLPARLDVEETAQLLGFQVHDIPILISAGLLKPLGNPSPSAPKWFASVELEVLSHDEKFLAKATKAVSSRWRVRNGRRKELAEQSDPATQP